VKIADGKEEKKPYKKEKTEMCKRRIIIKKRVLFFSDSKKPRYTISLIPSFENKNGTHRVLHRRISYQKG